MYLHQNTMMHRTVRTCLLYSPQNPAPSAETHIKTLYHNTSMDWTVRTCPLHMAHPPPPRAMANAQTLDQKPSIDSKTRTCPPCMAHTPAPRAMTEGCASTRAIRPQRRLTAACTNNLHRAAALSYVAAARRTKKERLIGSRRFGDLEPWAVVPAREFAAADGIEQLVKGVQQLSVKARKTALAEDWMHQVVKGMEALRLHDEQKPAENDDAMNQLVKAMDRLTITHSQPDTPCQASPVPPHTSASHIKTINEDVTNLLVKAMNRLTIAHSQPNTPCQASPVPTPPSASHTNEDDVILLVKAMEVLAIKPSQPDTPSVDTPCQTFHAPTSTSASHVEETTEDAVNQLVKEMELLAITHAQPASTRQALHTPPSSSQHLVKDNKRNLTTLKNCRKKVILTTNTTSSSDSVISKDKDTDLLVDERAVKHGPKLEKDLVKGNNQHDEEAVLHEEVSIPSCGKGYCPGVRERLSDKPDGTPATDNADVPHIDSKENNETASNETCVIPRSEEVQSLDCYNMVDRDSDTEVEEFLKQFPFLGSSEGNETEYMDKNKKNHAQVASDFESLSENNNSHPRTNCNDSAKETQDQRGSFFTEAKNSNQNTLTAETDETSLKKETVDDGQKDGCDSETMDAADMVYKADQDPHNVKSKASSNDMCSIPGSEDEHPLDCCNMSDSHSGVVEALNIYKGLADSGTDGSYKVLESQDMQQVENRYKGHANEPDGDTGNSVEKDCQESNETAAHHETRGTPMFEDDFDTDGSVSDTEFNKFLSKYVNFADESDEDNDSADSEGMEHVDNNGPEYDSTPRKMLVAFTDCNASISDKARDNSGNAAGTECMESNEEVADQETCVTSMFDEEHVDDMVHIICDQLTSKKSFEEFHNKRKGLLYRKLTASYNLINHEERDRPRKYSEYDWTQEYGSLDEEEWQDDEASDCTDDEASGPAEDDEASDCTETESGEMTDDDSYGSEEEQATDHNDKAASDNGPDYKEYEEFLKQFNFLDSSEEDTEDMESKDTSKNKDDRQQDNGKRRKVSSKDKQSIPGSGGKSVDLCDAGDNKRMRKAASKDSHIISGTEEKLSLAASARKKGQDGRGSAVSVANHNSNKAKDRQQKDKKRKVTINSIPGSEEQRAADFLVAVENKKMKTDFDVNDNDSDYDVEASLNV